MRFSEPNGGDYAHSWTEAKRLSRKRGYGEKVTVPKASEHTLPPGFERSCLSIEAGAEAVYRDQQETNSFQIREYEDKWTIELDRHNPETGNAIAHAVCDATEYTVAAVAASVAVISLLIRRYSYRSATSFGTQDKIMTSVFSYRSRRLLSVKDNFGENRS